MIVVLGIGLVGVLLGLFGGFILGRLGRASCPDCGNFKTCPTHEPVLREITRTGHAAGRVPAGFVVPLRDGNSGPGGHLDY
jgi:hypothetical protein